MEMLLKGGGQSNKSGEVIRFMSRVKEGCKVSYISNARVTRADTENWMALPIVEEEETEATCTRKHFLLLHVPSLREFVHKFDALPPPPATEQGQGPIKMEDPDIDTNSVVEASVITTASSVFTTDYDAEEESLKTGRSTSSMEGFSHSLSPFPATDSSYFVLDDAPSVQEESTRTQIDLTDLSDYFIPNDTDSEMQDAIEPEEITETPSSPISPLSICTYKIDPAPDVDCDAIQTTPFEDPTTSLMTLITQASANATAGVGATEGMTAETTEMVDLPTVRRVNAVAVRKQMNCLSPCPRCYVMVEKLGDARAHIEEGGCVQIGSHGCDVCGKRLSSKWTLKKHVERHSDRPRCVFCSNRFDSAEELRDHNLLSGHMFRPEEASAGSLELSQLRKQRKQEHEDTMRLRETTDNLSSIVGPLDTIAAVGPSEKKQKKQPPAKKRKMSGVVDETASAVAFLLAEEETQD